MVWIVHIVSPPVANGGKPLEVAANAVAAELAGGPGLGLTRTHVTAHAGTRRITLAATVNAADPASALEVARRTFAQACTAAGLSPTGRWQFDVVQRPAATERL